VNFTKTTEKPTHAFSKMKGSPFSLFTQKAENTAYKSCKDAFPKYLKTK